MQPISRRTVLRGLGTALALPVLDVMAPVMARAGQTAAEKLSPKRMAFIFVPNGVQMPDWTPAAEGVDFELPPILQPLAPFKEHLNVLSGLELDAGWAHGDGPGDHARAASTFLTGAHPRKTDGADIRAGVSVDQFAAKHLGSQTRFASLEIGCERGGQAGNCDSGYSCAYSSNISWSSPTTPVAKEIDPRLLFERLFSRGSRGGVLAARRQRDGYRRSVLDFVREDAQSLQRKLGAKDLKKLDEYFTGIREVEKRIGLAQSEVQAVEGVTAPDATPKDFGAHVRLMSDMLVLAFQGDLTRVATFMIANAGSNRSYPEIEISDGHHWLSHHENNAEKLQKISQINRFHVTQLAYLLGKLAAIREDDHSLLDQCMMVYGSGLGDGNRHNHDDLPILQIGKGGGTIQTGRHVRYAKETPLANLYLAMLQHAEVPTDTFADSTEPLKELAR